jgi:hypothetical protein
MFFDFVLDDSNLPAAFQALISRLQIPILKVALKDKGFFSKHAHPARKLVNTIASAGVGWDTDSPEKDKLYQLLTKTIQDILDNYTDNEHVFADKLAELEAFLESAEHRRNLIETRTSQAAQGQAITSLAKTTCQQLLLEHMKKAQLPVVVSEFLINHWQQYMVMSYIKHGHESPQWQGATQLVQDLIWASRKHSDEKSIARLAKIKQNLLDRISEGLSTVLNSASDCRTIADSIGSTLMALHSDSGNVESKPLLPAQAQALGHTPGSGTKSWKEMTALERQQAQYQALSYESIKQAESLPVNTWLSYEVAGEAKTVRCKLATKIDVNDSYVFVNRFGFKIIEKTRKDFAYDLQKGKAKPLTSTPLFERAFDTITGNLRKLQQQE